MAESNSTLSQQDDKIDAQDVISARLTQVDALLCMLTSSGEDGKGFAVPHKVVMSTLWAAQDLLAQAQKAVPKANATA